MAFWAPRHDVNCSAELDPLRRALGALAALGRGRAQGATPAAHRGGRGLSALGGHPPPVPLGAELSATGALPVTFGRVRKRMAGQVLG